MDETTNKDRQDADIWSEPKKDELRPIGFFAAVSMILIVIGIIAGAFGSISFSVDRVDSTIQFGSGVNYFWPGIIVQQVGSVWFGAWGILAGVIFPFFSNAIAFTPISLSVAYLPANFIQSFLPAYFFRKFGLNPGLKTGSDYFSLLLSMFIGNLFGAIWSIGMLIFVFKTVPLTSAGKYFFGWYGGNMVAGMVFNFILLKALTPVILKANALVRKWWS